MSDIILARFVRASSLSKRHLKGLVRAEGGVSRVAGDARHCAIVSLRPDDVEMYS